MNSGETGRVDEDDREKIYMNDRYPWKSSIEKKVVTHGNEAIHTERSVERGLLYTHTKEKYGEESSHIRRKYGGEASPVKREVKDISMELVGGT